MEPPAGVRRAAPLLGAACGGVLYFLGYAGWGAWPCLLVFLVPVWWALEQPGGRGATAAAGVGLVFGLAAYAGGFLWLWHLVDAFLDRNRFLGLVLWAACGVWFAFGFAAYAALVDVLRRRAVPLAVAGIAPLVLVEWLQPQVFPLYAGGGLVGVPLLMQTADLGGPLLLTAQLAAANLAVFETWSWWRGRRAPPRALWNATLAGVLLVAGYGRLRIAGVEAESRAAPSLAVGVVQANLGLLEKDAQSLVTHQRHLEQTRELLAGGGLDLVVWPESAYIRGLRGPLPISGRPILEELTIPLLFGASGVREENGRRLKSNSALLIGSDGMIRDGYEKNLLIPLAEHLPLAHVMPGIARWFPHSAEFAASHETPALHLGRWRIATPICYEAIRPEFVRRMVRASRPHLLITLANDAWFGASQEPWLHLALVRLRAVEHRRFVVRATNSGVSAVIDPAGRIVARTHLFTRENLRAVVHPLDGETLYCRLGDWPGGLAAVVVGLLLVRRPRASLR